MSSMDHLRNKLRSQRADTDELNQNLVSGFGYDTPQEARGTTQLPSTAELSESILAQAQSDTDILFQDINLDEPEVDFQVKQKRRFSLIEKLDALEINKKMLGISLGVAALASFLATSYIQSGYLDVAGQNKMIEVVVLTQDIPARTKLSREMLEIKKVPSTYIPQGAIHYNPDNKILDKVTLTKMYKGELLHSERISLPDSRTGITGVIPKGHKAIPLKTNDAYLMKPNDFVDIIVSLPDPNPGSKDKLVPIPILQRAQLIAVGQQYSEEASTDNQNAREITVAVPNDRVNLMSLLEQKGNFKVVLRSRDDKSILPEKYTIQEIEDALMGRLELVKVEEKKPETEAKKEAPKQEASPKEAKKVLKDLSAPARTYSAPARTYSAPARTYSAPRYTPPQRSYAPPQRAYTPPAPVRQAPVRQAPVVINGGSCTQGC